MSTRKNGKSFKKTKGAVG
jgi:hypothetical protein